MVLYLLFYFWISLGFVAVHVNIMVLMLPMQKLDSHSSNTLVIFSHFSKQHFC